MKTKIFLTIISSLFTVLPIFAQVGLGTNNPDANAILDVVSTNKGVILPRVKLSAINNASPMSAHVAGMMVYCDTTAGVAPNNVTPGYYYNNGTKWVRIISSNDADNTVDAFVNDSTNSQVKLATQSNGTMARAANTDFVITDSGKVGVGTNSPSQKLDVNGKIKVRSVEKISNADTFLVLKNGVISAVTRTELINASSTRRIIIGALAADGLGFEVGTTLNNARKKILSRNNFGSDGVVNDIYFEIKTFNSAAGISKQNMDILFLAQFPDASVYSGMMDSIDHFVAAGGIVFTHSDNNTLDAVSAHFGFAATLTSAATFTPTAYGTSTLFSGSFGTITGSIATENQESEFTAAVGSGVGKNAEIIAVDGATNRIIKVLNKNVFISGDVGTLYDPSVSNDESYDTNNEKYILNAFEYLGLLVP